MAIARDGVEKKVITTAAIFVVSLAAVIGLSVKLYSIDLPTCLADVKPYSEGKLIRQAENRYEVHYLAKMWKFEPSEISVTPGSTVDVYLAAADVTHGLQIVGTNVNLMAVPGAVNFARVRFPRPGDYLVVCNEYCGINHQNMAGIIHVTAEAPPPVAESAAEAAEAGHEAAEGMALLEANACTACHSLDGTDGPGPTLKGVYGKQRQLADGSVVTADEAYLTESIVSPEAKIVKNYEPSMPPSDLSPEEVEEIIEYLKTIQ